MWILFGEGIVSLQGCGKNDQLTIFVSDPGKLLFIAWVKKITWQDKNCIPITPIKSDGVHLSVKVDTPLMMETISFKVIQKGQRGAAASH